jgi:DNA-binding transcriptional MerR regulator
MMQIGDLAAQSGVPAKTIRYYEAIGLLPPPARAANNRQYGPADIRRLQLISSARSLSFTLDAVTEILALRDQGIAPCNRVLERLDAQLAALEQRITNLLALREDLRLIRTLGSQLPRDDVAGMACVCALVQAYQTGGSTVSPSTEVT